MGYNFQVDELHLAKMIFISRKNQGISVDYEDIIKEVDRIIEENKDHER